MAFLSFSRTFSFDALNQYFALYAYESDKGTARSKALREPATTRKRKSQATPELKATPDSGRNNGEQHAAKRRKTSRRIRQGQGPRTRNSEEPQAESLSTGARAPDIPPVAGTNQVASPASVRTPASSTGLSSSLSKSPASPARQRDGDRMPSPPPAYSTLCNSSPGGSQSEYTDIFSRGFQPDTKRPHTNRPDIKGSITVVPP